MNAWPVLTREVRQASRHPTTYRVRSLAALVLLLVTTFLCLASPFRASLMDPGRGGQVFSTLHMTLFFLTWFFVPVLAADCLSRERREGTLGLLFLTPLGSVDIVVAKLALQLIRAATLWLAALPMLMVPVLLGGVSARQALVAGLYDLSALFLALAAGLVASAWSRRWGRAVVRAVLFALTLGALLVFVQGRLAFRPVLVATGSTAFNVNLPPLFSASSFWRGAQIIAGSGSLVSPITYVPMGGGFRVAASPPALSAGMGSVVISVMLLAMAILLAAWKTRRSWREEPPSALRLKVERGLTTPILGRNFLKRGLQRALSRNPVGWLELRTWSGRMVMFAWLAIVIGTITGLLTQYGLMSRVLWRLGYDALPRLVAFLLLISLAASAAASFRRERETGLLELLLVSPMSAKAMVWGRLRALYLQFLPSVTLLVAAWLFLLTLPGAKGSLQPLAAFVIAAFATPSIGLYFSLRARNFLAALLLSLTFTFVLPWLLSLCAGMFVWAVSTPAVAPVTRFDRQVPLLSEMLQLSLALLAIRELVRRLEARQFEFNREVT